MTAGKPFQLILNPIRDWNFGIARNDYPGSEFQLILNPIRDWNYDCCFVCNICAWAFQLILNPIRDWNRPLTSLDPEVRVPINLKPY